LAEKFGEIYIKKGTEYLCFIVDGKLYEVLGDYAGSADPDDPPGSAWIDGDKLYYIDDTPSRNKRFIRFDDVGRSQWPGGLFLHPEGTLWFSTQQGRKMLLNHVDEHHSGYENILDEAAHLDSLHSDFPQTHSDVYEYTVGDYTYYETTHYDFTFGHSDRGVRSGVEELTTEIHADVPEGPPYTDTMYHVDDKQTYSDRGYNWSDTMARDHNDYADGYHVDSGSSHNDKMIFRQYADYTDQIPAIYYDHLHYKDKGVYYDFIFRDLVDIGDEWWHIDKNAGDLQYTDWTDPEHPKLEPIRLYYDWSDVYPESYADHNDAGRIYSDITPAHNLHSDKAAHGDYSDSFHHIHGDVPGATTGNEPGKQSYPFDPNHYDYSDHTDGIWWGAQTGDPYYTDFPPEYADGYHGDRPDDFNEYIQYDIRDKYADATDLSYDGDGYYHYDHMDIYDRDTGSPSPWEPEFFYEHTDSGFEYEGEVTWNDVNYHADLWPEHDDVYYYEGGSPETYADYADGWYFPNIWIYSWDGNYSYIHDSWWVHVNSVPHFDSPAEMWVDHVNQAYLDRPREELHTDLWHHVNAPHMDSPPPGQGYRHEHEHANISHADSGPEVPKPPHSDAQWHHETEYFVFTYQDHNDIINIPHADYTDIVPGGHGDSPRLVHQDANWSFDD